MRVLVVDDSPVVRKILRSFLENEQRILSVETAPSGKIALNKIRRLDPDVVTLDLHMPGMDGLATLRRIMATSPRPVLVVSAHTADGAAKSIRALELGAVDVIQKPGGTLSRDIEDIGADIVSKVVAIGESWKKRRQRKREQTADRSLEIPPQEFTHKHQTVEGGSPRVVAIGASTGGIEAIRAVLCRLPKEFPAGIVIVQHMPAGFTKAFAERMNELCQLNVKEASHRDLILPGRVLIAPGGRHMTIRHRRQGLLAELDSRPEVSGHRPSVDILFDSVAKACGDTTVAVILTGMGRDGAAGMGSIHTNGGTTIAQNEKSCVVFGMPKAAIESGVVDKVMEISRIPQLLKRLMCRPRVLKSNALQL